VVALYDGVGTGEDFFREARTIILGICTTQKVTNYLASRGCFFFFESWAAKSFS